MEAHTAGSANARLQKFDVQHAHFWKLGLLRKSIIIMGLEKMEKCFFCGMCPFSKACMMMHGAVENTWTIFPQVHK